MKPKRIQSWFSCYSSHHHQCGNASLHWRCAQSSASMRWVFVLKQWFFIVEKPARHTDWLGFINHCKCFTLRVGQNIPHVRLLGRGQPLARRRRRAQKFVCWSERALFSPFFHNVTLQSIGTIRTNRFSSYTKNSVRDEI